MAAFDHNLGETQVDAVTSLCIYVDRFSSYEGLGRLRGLRQAVLVRFWSAGTYEMNPQLRVEEEEVMEVLMDQLRVQGHVKQGDVEVINPEDTWDLGKDCEARAF